MRIPYCKFIFVMGLTFLAVTLSSAGDRIWLKDFKVNGKPVKMVFDSNSDGIILTSGAVKRLGLKIVDPPTNGLPAFTDTYAVDFEGSAFRTDFAVIDVPQYAASDFDGILGWWALHSSTFRLDGEDRRLAFLWHVPRETKNWTKFVIVTNDGTLGLEVKHSDGTKGVITVDTGAWYGIGLSRRLWRQWREAHPNSPLTLQATIGPSGLAVDEEAFADKIEMGPLWVTDVPVLQLDTNDITAPAHDNQDCVLGLAALGRLDFVVDGPHNAAYLRARTSRPRPYSYNHLGAVFTATMDHRDEFLAWVIPESPAYEAGIRNGDILLQVDGIHATTWSETWLHKFELPAETRLRFLLQRNGTNFETVATLRNILQPDD
jgi:PDZ domain